MSLSFQLSSRKLLKRDLFADFGLIIFVRKLEAIIFKIQRRLDDDRMALFVTQTYTERLFIADNMPFIVY